MLGVVMLTSCLSGLQPLPDTLEDLDLSLSIPVAKAEIGLSGTYHKGLPNINLGLNVPDWAKYDTLYFTDTVAVDLYKIFENSDNIKYLAFKINIWNQFPVKGHLNIHFADNAGNIIYSFEPVEIKDGSPIIRNGDLLLIRSGYSKANVEFDLTKIESIRVASFLVFEMKINLVDKENIYLFEYFDQFKMDCQIGARIDFILKDI